MIKKTLFLTVYFLSPLLPIMAIYNSNPAYYGAKGLIPMILGSTAFTWLNAQLILSARPKWIERNFGLDRFYKFHGIMALIAISIGFIHKLMKETVFSESLKTKIGDFAIIVFMIAAGLALAFMIDTLVNLIKPLKVIRTWLKELKVGNYNFQVLLHNINFGAVVLIFIHVTLTYSAHNMLVKSSYIFCFGLSTAFYLYHKIVRKYILTKKFTVETVKAESDSMWTLTLKPKNGKPFYYKPGQFGFLRITSGLLSAEEHPFSFTSTPGNNNVVNLTIKNLGDWTTDVPLIRPGDTALLDGPYGRFGPLFHSSRNDTVLIAGGVGITPMLSILRHYYVVDKNKKITLFWGVNTTSELICHDEFEAFKAEMPNFTLVPVVARGDSFEGEKGFLSEKIITKYLTANGYDKNKVKFFFCGPPPMLKSVYAILKSMKIKHKNIHYESFSL